MPEVVMPRLSDAMEEGTILRWLKQEGEQVTRGEPLAEIETDKATVTYDADDEGILRIIAGEGETVPIGSRIAWVGEDFHDGEGLVSAGGARVGGVSAVPEPAAPARFSAGREPQPGGNGRARSARSGRPKASPLARRLALEAGIDLSGLSGSGPGGRIVRADVLALREGAPADVTASEAAAPTAAPATAKGGARVQQLSRIQRQIAQRMAESRATVPDFTLSSEVAMDAAVALRGQLLAAAGQEPVPSYNDMVVKASALALREHPRANGAYRDGAFELYDRVNVGIAVAAEDRLIVPTVFDADRKSLGEIARESRLLAQRVRDGAITPPELAGATFTVSNLGMYGVTSFAAIINPPQAAILAVGAVREVPVVREGEIVPGHLMSITLSCDHRILYGAPAAEFLGRIRALLEQPVALML